jgi:hypothetical protein
LTQLTAEHLNAAAMPPEIPGDLNTAELPEAESVNDADLLGKETPGYLAILEQDATLLLGEMWGAKDRRNTQDGDWNAVTKSWKEWIIGGKGTKNTPAWGFSRHPVGKNKAGASIVLGSSIGGARTAKAMDTMYAMGVDIDNGTNLDDVLEKLERLGLFCLVYTSHSYGKTKLELKHDDVLRKLGIRSAEIDLAAVKTYLRDHDKNRYPEDFLAGITQPPVKTHTTKGWVIEVTTPPIDKYRLILPLAQPVKLSDLADTEGEYPDAAKTALAGRVGAMAGAVREWNADREDAPERQGRYVFQKAGQDKYGTLYRLERLDLA